MGGSSNGKGQVRQGGLYVGEAIKRQSNIQQNRLLRKGVYAISSLLGNRGKGQEDVYNGFKDEFTDWSKYKGRGMSI